MELAEVITAVKEAVTEALSGKAGTTKLIYRPDDLPESRATTNRRMKSDPDFPKPIELNDGGGIGFWGSEIEEYYRKKPRIDRYTGQS